MSKIGHAFVLTALAALCAGCARERPARSAEASSQATLTSGDAMHGDTLRVSPALAAACDLEQNADSSPRFALDDSTLTPSDRDTLAKLAECLTTGALRGRDVALVGRADPRGTEQYNMVLGAKRANEVAAYLGHLGVDRGRVRETSRGELDARGTDEASWQHDRRVDIDLLEARAN